MDACMLARLQQSNLHGLSNRSDLTYPDVRPATYHGMAGESEFKSCDNVLGKLAVGTAEILSSHIIQY